MAIAIRAVGTWTDTTANLTVTIPSSPSAPQAGDLMIMYYGTKPYNDVPSIDQSWIDAGAATNGTTAAGNDVGSMQARIFYKIHTGTESNPTVTNTTNNVSAASIVVFSKDPVKSWDLAFGGGGDTSSNVVFSIITTNTLNVAAGDMLAGFLVAPSDNPTITSHNFQAGIVTIGTRVLAPATNLLTGTGGDLSISGVYAPCNSNTATTAVTLSATTNVNATGTGYLIRMREVDGFTPSDPFGVMGFFGI